MFRRRSRCLSPKRSKPTTGDLLAHANIIKRTLDSFGIPVEMGEINVGPAVTRYTLKPAEGVKLSRITALNPDLALSLAAHPIRIEAPIPGKSLVGIEVPNKAAALVRLGSLMNYPEFQAVRPARLRARPRRFRRTDLCEHRKDAAHARRRRHRFRKINFGALAHHFAPL